MAKYISALGAAVVAAALGGGAPVARADGFLFELFRTPTKAEVVVTLSGWQPTVIAAVAPAPNYPNVGPAAPAYPVALGLRAPAASHDPMASAPRLTGEAHKLSGVASYYWQDQMTATGERFNKRDMTAAHKTLPFGTKVRVTRVDTGRSVVVRINDRGPYKPGRVIDLSERAAEQLSMTGVGVTPVKLEVLGR